MHRDYRKEMIEILEDFNMPNPREMLTPLSDIEVKQFYKLIQKVMIRITVQQFRESGGAK
jgi:hypothetical protein